MTDSILHLELEFVCFHYIQIYSGSTMAQSMRNHTQCTAFIDICGERKKHSSIFAHTHSHTQTQNTQ